MVVIIVIPSFRWPASSRRAGPRVSCVSTSRAESRIERQIEAVPLVELANLGNV